MHDPTTHSQPSTGYIVDAENVAEMARLIRQAQTLTEHFGLLPNSIEPAPATRILDIACGPAHGRWNKTSRFECAILLTRLSSLL